MLVPVCEMSAVIYDGLSDVSSVCVMSAVIYDGLSDVSSRMCNACSYI